jgi:hypothetical protein
MDDDIAAYVSEYLKQLRDNAQNAWFSLVEVDDSAIPLLIDAYHFESNLAVKETLVEIIWQHRNPVVLDFLGEVLQHEDARLWKMALDGTVAINDRGGISVLEAEKNRLQAIQSDQANDLI